MMTDDERERVESILRKYHFEIAKAQPPELEEIKIGFKAELIGYFDTLAGLGVFDTPEAQKCGRYEKPDTLGQMMREYAQIAVMYGWTRVILDYTEDLRGWAAQLEDGDKRECAQGIITDLWWATVSFSKKLHEIRESE